jgi:hypothetical protein
MTIPAELLNLAGEYAVASQLARLCHYAQLTFGNRKRTDILVDAANGTLFRVEVKAKQDREWLRVQAPRQGDFIILVDFQRKAREEPPEFYVLDFHDWVALVEAYRQRRPQIQVDELYCVRHPDGWVGLNLTVEWVRQHRSAWSKLPGTRKADEST